MNRTCFSVVAAAAAATTAALAVQLPVNAACIGGDGICATFVPNTTSTPTNVSFTPLTPTNTVSQTGLQYGRLIFSVSGLTSGAFTLTNISLTGNSAPTISPTSLSFTGTSPETLTIGGSQSNNFFQFSPINSLDWANSILSFTIPAGINTGATISAYVQYGVDTTGVGVTTYTSGAFTTTATDLPPAPGPLPLFGAGAAFGFSRRLRKRLAHAA